MRLLVIGAFTPLGRALAPRLARRLDHDVLATDRALPPGAVLPGVSLATLAPARPDEVRRLLLDFAPHTVVFLSRWHEAARCAAAPSACEAALADTAEVLARACLAIGARLVVHSSDLVFPGALGAVYRETDRPAPTTRAGKHHLALENAARGAGLNRWAVLRTGPLVVPAALPRPDVDLATFARPYTPVEVAAHGAERLILQQAHGLFHVAGHALHTPQGWAHAHGRAPSPGLAATHATALLTLRAETELGVRL